MTIFARKDRAVSLRPMTVEDIEEVREVGQIAWSDLALHDIGRKFRYPKRSEKIIDAYIWKDPHGCIVADEEGKIVGSAFCHTWGKVGWVGPLEVLPDRQDRGIGKMLLRACQDHLERRGCQVIGLETMTHLPKHLHFYMSSGYRPGPLTLIMEKVLRQQLAEPLVPEETSPESLDRDLREVSDLSARVNPFLDYSIEAEAIVRKRLGLVYLLRKEGRLSGAALLHTYQRGEEASYSSIKALLVDPRDPDPRATFNALLSTCEMRSLEEGKNRLLVRFAGGDLGLYGLLMASSYVLKGANVRMVRTGDYFEHGQYNITSWAG
jgi:GNAT superfamily N-acetyltransferase